MKTNLSWGHKGWVDSALLIGFLGIFTIVLGQMTLRFANSLKQKSTLQAFNYLTASGAETMVFAHRLAQISYIKSVSNQKCSNSKPFLQALKEGSGCIEPITVFTASDASGYKEQLPFSYVSNGGCQISTSGSNCGKGSKVILTAPLVGASGAESPDPTKPGEKAGYVFSLNSINLSKGLIEFSVSVTVNASPNQMTTQKYALAIRSGLTNAAHLEADGRVTQENPEPLAKCPGASWATFLLFNNNHQKCEEFSQLGSGTGLAFFNDHYFGFRPFDGQIIDMSSLQISTASSYLVSEDGTVNGKLTFVPYRKDALVNVDDITVIPISTANTSTGSSQVTGQLYYVSGQGEYAHIGALTPNGDRQIICELGKMGWSQAYEGIAATSFSIPVIPIANDGITAQRLAFFYLKTSGGDCLTATVLRDSTNSLTCHVAKEGHLQQIEYARTYGFDRTASNLPYYIY
ncbi:hypothetical protein EBQ74_00915 [bacterium]|nr:hypothetical protein [bacterium]